MQPIRIVFFRNPHRFFLGLDRPRHSVYDCHPPKVVPMVKGLIEKLRSGEKDSLGFETVKKGKKARVRYLAVRDRERAYLGTLEVVEELS